MKILLLLRKKPDDIGGLTRFSSELASRLPEESTAVNPLSAPFSLFRLDYSAFDLIHLTDAVHLPL